MSEPSPLWYTTRGAGTVTLILLTGVVVLGIVTSTRWKSEDWPRFLIAALHRNFSLFLVAFGLLHIVTALFDPAVFLGLKALIPFASDYRPLWLSLGVISGDLILAIVLTSLLRDRLGYLAWRIIHWLTYASWPLPMRPGSCSSQPVAPPPSWPRSSGASGWASKSTPTCASSAKACAP